MAKKIINQESVQEVIVAKPKHLRRLGWRLLTFAVIVMVGFRLFYAGRILPGVSVAGIYVGGLDKAAALSAVQEGTREYQRLLVPMTYGNTTVRIPVAKLELKYNLEADINRAAGHGFQGSILSQAKAQARALVGRSTNYANLSYSDTDLYNYLKLVDDDYNRSVGNAGLDFAGGAVQVVPAAIGRRVDLGRLTQLVIDRFSRSSDDNVEVPAYELAPIISTGMLEPVKTRAALYLHTPIQLVAGETKIEIDRPQILKWISLTTSTSNSLLLLDLTNFYYAQSPVSIRLNDTTIGQYVAGLTKQFDSPAQNAALSITDGRATVFTPSKTGQKLDQIKTTAAIVTALNSPDPTRQAILALAPVKPAVTEESLNNLGIKELIGRGQTTFPGSDAARLVNIRIGAAKFNGVLIKPGDVLSAGDTIGEVGPEQGYVPANVILANKVEKQYGGGLCQVTSTAFRAALLSGLMIMERVNHSFVVPYYTAPYGAPGLDAAIYYPPTDLKFKNDTDSYILIQTKMEGITLTFDFYGTKLKEGRIRGPEFIYGSSDATKPSKTIFYRDILDLNGNILKTSSFTSTYASSDDYPKVAEIQ